MERKFLKMFWSGLLIFLATFVVYYPALHNGFVWDDDVYITDPALLNGHGLIKIWTDTTLSEHPYYPLTHTLFWIEGQLWGPHPLGYHVINILLHALGALCVWWILMKLKVPGAWGCALIYAVHPVCVESVAWIAERKNLLAVFFYWLSMLSFLQFYPLAGTEQDINQLKRWGWYAWSLVFFILSLLSKTAFCTLPVVLLLIIWWKKGRVSFQHLRLLVPFVIVAFAMGLFTIWLERYHVGAQGDAWEFSWAQRIIISSRAFWFYLAKIIWPEPLIFIYPRWIIDPQNVWLWIYPLSLGSSLFYLWIMKKRWGVGPLACVLFSLVTVLPALGLIDFYLMRYTFVADHLQYLSCLGFIVLISQGLWRIFTKEKWAMTAFVFLALPLGVITFHQNTIYKDNLTLFSEVILRNPQCWMALNNRGNIYLDKKQFDLAIADFNRAIEINPHFEEVFNNRGVLFLETRDYSRAREDFEKSIAINSNYAKAYNNLAALDFTEKKYEESRRHYDFALQLDPRYAEAYNGRGAVHSVLKEHQKALDDYAEALRLNPEMGRAYLNRCLTYWEMKDYHQALENARIAENMGFDLPDRFFATVEYLIAHPLKSSEEESSLDKVLNLETKSQ